MADVAESCFHCRGAIPPGTAVTEERDGIRLRFCCRGCHGAYLLIAGAGLGDYYSRREWQDAGLGAEAFRGAYDDRQLARSVYPCGGLSAIDIVIGGIRCASCVWLNEKIIGRLPGVRDVRVNYATGRARVVFAAGEIAPAAILARIAALGYVPRPYTQSAAEESAEGERKDLLVRFGTAFFLTMQLMAYSCALYAGYFQGMAPEMKRWMQLFSLLVTTPVVFYAGWPFLAGGWRGIVNGAPTMDLLVAVGALSSYGYSIYAALSGGEVYFETAAMIVTLILAGRLLENAARRRASGGIERLMQLAAGEAQRIVPGGIERVAVEELRAGDLVLVGPGERVPADGAIAEGSTDVDESPATGEPMPLARVIGDPVIAGSINLTGTIRVVCDRPAADSFIARVARLVEEAQSRRAPIQGVADRVAAYFVPAVLLLGLATFLWQYLSLAPPGAALMAALAVVVIACPCALGLATPTAILAGSGAAAACGVIFKGGDVLERLSRVGVVLFDKTGTVTGGVPEVVGILPASGYSAGEVVALAAAVESGSLHPIGRAVCRHAASLGLDVPWGTDVRAIPGGGVTGLVGGQPAAVGSGRFMADQGIAGMPGSVAAPTDGTGVHVACAGRYAGTVVVQDRLRDEAPAVAAYFRGMGVRCTLVSGDRDETARLVAGRLALDDGVGDMSPADKARFIEDLRGHGETVLMVGDGINDAPALAEADVGCAVAGGTDIALETSDLVLAKPDLQRLVHAHRIARRTMAIIRQNFGWAIIYNLVGIPLAMTGRLTPIYAAAAMALSSLSVVLNSLRLSRVRHG